MDTELNKLEFECHIRKLEMGFSTHPSVQRDAKGPILKPNSLNLQKNNSPCCRLMPTKIGLKSL